jgi:ankyrin repeat protein
MRQSNLSLALAATAVLVVLVVLAVLFFPGRVAPGSPLAKAAAAGDTGEVKALLDGGAPPESPTEGWSPLMWAARSGNVKSVQALAEAGADPDRRDDGPNGWTPLLHAVHKDQADAVRALIAAGADVNRPAPNGLTPLMLAASQGEAEVVELLLQAGADPHAESRGMTTLHHALLGANPRVVEAVLRDAPDLRLGDGWRDWAVRGFTRLRGRSELVARLDQARRSVR